MHITKTVIYPQSHHQSQNSQQIQTLTIDLQIYLFHYSRYNWLIYLFIDLLVEGQKTILGTSSKENITALSALHQHLKMKNLPPIELVIFDGNPSCGSEFVESMKIMDYLKTIFNDTIRMERLLSVLRGDTKRLVESIGRNSIFYATTSKCLKREFRNPNIVTQLKLKSLFDQPQVKAVYLALLKLYHQKFKCTNTWLVSPRHLHPLKT